MTKQYSFIDPNNVEMCIWAYNYLKRRFSLPPKKNFEDEYSFCCNVMPSLGSGEERLRLELKMQTAWRQKMFRESQKRKGTKACSFMLSEIAIKELNSVSRNKGLSINETLVGLIHQAYLNDLRHLKKQISKSLDILSEQLKKTNI